MKKINQSNLSKINKRMQGNVWFVFYITIKFFKINFFMCKTWL
jgi:hypothetical protein